jgi:orotate phosphoribosyltransferase
MGARNARSSLPVREGHFLLESGYHSSVWLTLDALFVDADKVAPLIDALKDKLQRHEVSGVCGPLLGGALLAFALASKLGARFFFSTPSSTSEGLFKAEYVLPGDLSRLVRGARVALVDDVISAGSSVRATKKALDEAGASTVVVGALMMLGSRGADYFSAERIPVEAVEHRTFTMWKPDECPLCKAGEPVVDPRTTD